MTRQVFYTIRIDGHLDPKWSEWFEGLTLISVNRVESDEPPDSIHS